MVAICDSEYGDIPGLEPGTHTVKIRATLPGTTVSFNTLPTEINLKCPETVSDNTNAVPDVDMADAQIEEDANNADFADENGGNGGGCTSIRSSPLHPILFFLFVFAIIPFRRRNLQS